jgi:hypothetical protein
VLGVVIVAIVGNLANRVLLARGEAAAVLDPLRDPRTSGGTP